MQQETKFGVRVDRHLKSLQGCWFCNIQQVAIRGIPDRIGCIDGKFFALEMKVSAKARRAKLQEYVIDKINKAGGYARFIYPENFEEVMEGLSEI